MDLRFFLGHAHLFAVMTGHIQQSFDCERHIRRIMQPIFGWDLGGCGLFVETFVFIFGDLTLFTVPYCLETVNLLAIKPDWVTNKLGKFSDYLFDFLLL